MGIALTTAGVKVYYGTDFATKTEIPEVTEIPELNPAPESIESTTLAETKYKTYVSGLKDLGGALSFTVNFNEEFITAYEALLLEQGSDETKLFIVIPGLEKHLEVPGEFSELGLPSIGVNQVLQNNFYFTPSGAPEWIKASA